MVSRDIKVRAVSAWMLMAIAGNMMTSDVKIPKAEISKTELAADAKVELVGNLEIQYYQKDLEITGVDIVDRGYPNTIVQNFLEWETDNRFEMILTNPPYSLATEFAYKGLSLLTDETDNTANGQMAMFLKIQFLEGEKREKLFRDYPPKYIYVFRNRMATWNRGKPINPVTGKKWATTMCHAWFVWENGSQTEPTIRWL